MDEINEILGTITIPGNPLLLKNGKWASCKPGFNKRHRCGFMPYIISGLKMNKGEGKKKTCTKKDKSNLALLIQSQWKRNTIETQYVNLKMTFFIPAFKFSKVPDQSNLYQIWEDLFQLTVIKSGVITRYGAGIYTDDVQVGGHDGSRRRFLCETCEWGGGKGTRTKSFESKRSGFMVRCPGARKCKQARTVIEVSLLLD